ncbi:Maf family protein [Methylovorus glucosotrophus]|uniref:dTTP/UTP pyrophosphatase n=1 Tax=Methylovorus glucosotrophus (strain SIP3-4) TaxID=582744 RepID=C6X9P6_METGS|nr:Maf family protein [Methylovorus glucosotrophus]ACT49866.1 maf protein [Methylovorus glucosotrophus SIP3-4]
MMKKRLYLASRSPRRAELLQQLGLETIFMAADVDESPLPDEAPHDYVLRLARAKAETGLAAWQAQGGEALPLLAADTTVAIDGLILGKPEDDADARAMLLRMSGRWHEVHTGVAVASASGVHVRLSTTRVEMTTLDEATIQAYIATGEPRDKAGAYGIQGLASTFIRRIEGSYSGVMGLPVFETSELLKQAGISVL